MAFWSLLVLGSAEVAGLADWRQAAPAAAAVEFVVASFEILDDIQDGDPNPIISQHGLPQALNIALGLLVLGQSALLRLPARGVGQQTVLAVQRELIDAIAVVGGGQYLDLAAETRPSLSEAEMLEVAERKTAGLTAGACRIGARLGTSQAEVLDPLGRFGWHFGLADQLQNDIEGAREGAREGTHGRRETSDRRRGKKTLPVFTAAFDDLVVEGAARSAGDGTDRIALASSGALHYTWVIADLHRQQARAILGELGPGRPIGGLLELL